MPQPAEVDALADPLAAKYQAASKRILDWQIRLATDPRQESRRRRLLEQQRAILDDMAALDEEAAAWVSRQLPKVYALGGAAGASQATGGLGDFVWSQIHQTATQNIAQGLYRNLLEATKKTAETTKRLVREIGQDQALASAIEGQTAQAAGREMARLLEKQGVHAVTYANGARQAIGPYSEMAIRSVTAETYNVGTLNSAAEKGTKYWEVFDGPFCGWTSHDDSKAAGKIVTRDEALAWPTSHPNCRRAFGARPDVLTAKDAKNAKSMVSDEQTAAQVQADIEKAGKKAFREDRPSTLPEEAASGRTGLTFTDKDVLIDGHKVGTIQSSGGHWLATLDVPGRNVQYTGSSYEEVTRKLERGTRKEVAKFQAEHDPKPAPPSTPKPPDIVKPNIPNTPDYENLFRGLPTIPEIRKAHVGWTTARAEKELKRLQLERVPTVEQLTKSHVGWTRARAEKERARIIETIHNGGTPEVPKPPPKPPWKPPTPPKRPTPADIYNEVEDALAGRKFPGGRAKQVARSKEWERIAEKHGLTTQEVAELYAEGRGAPGTVKPHGPKPKPPKGLNPNNLPEDQVREFGDMVNSIRAEFGRATTANLRQLKQLFPDMAGFSDSQLKAVLARADELNAPGGHGPKPGTHKHPGPQQGTTEMAKNWSNVSSTEAESFWKQWTRLNESNSALTRLDVADSFPTLRVLTDAQLQTLLRMTGERMRGLATGKVPNWNKFVARTVPRAEVQARAVRSPAIYQAEWQQLVSELGRQYDRVPEAASRLDGGVGALSHEAVQREFSGQNVEGRVLAFYRPSERKIFMSERQFTAAATNNQRRMERQGWFTPCGSHTTGGTATFAHEFGHHVDHFLHDLSTSQRRNVVREVSRILKRHGFNNKIVTNFGSVEVWAEENKAILAKAISKYGSTNTNEMMAEIWAEYTTSQHPRKWIQEIGELIERAARGDVIS